MLAKTKAKQRIGEFDEVLKGNCCSQVANSISDSVVGTFAAVANHPAIAEPLKVFIHSVMARMNAMAARNMESGTVPTHPREMA